MKAFFAPRGVAVVGASRDGAKLGAVMGRALAGYPGGCVLVNSRNPDPAAGVYASVAEGRQATGNVVDLAVLCVPAAATAGALAAAAGAGATAALVCAGGFGEAGETGHERAVLDVVARTGIRLLGPNTSGFFVPARGLHASFVPGAAEVPAGDIAIVASSGGVNHALAFELAGVRLAVGIGAGLDVAATDVLDYLAADPGTAAVALHVETVPDGPRLLASIRALTAVKPVVAVVVGRGDVGDFARSHTGALATSWRTTRAALRQAGAVVVDDERELVDAVTALAAVRLAPSADPGVGVVTAQAGPGLLLVDRLRADGLRVPELTPSTQDTIGALLPPLTYQRNPVDTGRPDSGFSKVLRAVADDPGVDLLVGYALAEPDSVDLAAAVQDAGLPAAVPTVLATGGPAADVGQVRSQLRKIGIPVFGGPAAAAVAVRALVADARRAATTALSPTRPQWIIPESVDEAQAKDFLAALGIRVPAGRVCANRAEAEQALAELGGPVAVKILDAAITHKTEIGGVQLGVRTPTELVRALDRIGGARHLIEVMAEDGVELVVGACRDPVFGPVVLLGLGGTTAEALADVTIRVAPVSAADAARMPGELAGAALLSGWRGLPALDVDELAAVLVALGDALVTMPELEEIEINPLRVTADGLIALDAYMRGD
jgi:acetate---CoA ligase (ADP-forming)